MAIIKGGESMRKSSAPTKVKTPEIKVGTEVKHTGVYDYVDTEYEGIKKVVSNQGGFLVFLDYGRVEKINKKTGLLEIKQDKALKRVETISEASDLRLEAVQIREKRSALGIHNAYQVKSVEKFTLKDAIENFKQDKLYTQLSENYKIHYDNYCKHIVDFMGFKEPKDITVKDIEAYYKHLLERGNYDSVRRNKDGSINKKEVSRYNPQGLSVNTIGKHKTALKRIFTYMIREGIYGVQKNIAQLSETPSVPITVDNKTIYVKKIQPEQRPLTLEELNYTLNDAIQNEPDRSVAVLIALGSIGGLRRSETAALKIGRYYHDDRMLLGDDLWKLNDFYKLRTYYEEHNELILIDEAIMHNRIDELMLPKRNTVRMIGKPKCLDEIVEYYMEQRRQLNTVLGGSIDGSQKLYIPMRNLILNEDYQVSKVTRKWKEYQERRNKRMEAEGLEPIEIVRFHDLRHTHATLMYEKVPIPCISRNMGHPCVGDKKEDNKNTTHVYIHDRKPNRTEVINFWDENIHIDWDKARRDDINAPGNKAHVNGSGHVVLKDEEMARIRNLKGRPWLSEEEEAELLCSKYKDAE